MSSFVFFNDTATTEIYTLSLHDALPISRRADRAHGRAAVDRRPARDRVHVQRARARRVAAARGVQGSSRSERSRDRKSTRLNSSHANISYAVFCLKKKKHYHY